MLARGELLIGRVLLGRLGPKEKALEGEGETRGSDALTGLPGGVVL